METSSNQKAALPVSRGATPPPQRAGFARTELVFEAGVGAGPVGCGLAWVRKMAGVLTKVSRCAVGVLGQQAKLAAPVSVASQRKHNCE